MAKKAEGRTFNISVIGLSGTEREKGQYGVGKSCLCNRFIHQVADKYHLEHISVLSQSDFAGRIINNDHFLYWGEASKTDEGNNYTFHVVEQTEFIDDVSFQPFKTGRTEPYIKRCMATKVQSAEKLMYICKDQLGMETDSSYEQKLMPEGRLNIDGFLCCFDVSQVPQRLCEKQVEFVASLLSAALKTKKPVVLASTKHDEADEQMVRELEKLLGRKEFKGNVPLLETSAHENVNVEAAFMLLAHLIDRSKARFKILPYVDAARQRREICQVATEAYRHLLRSHIVEPRASWATSRRQLETEQDFIHYLDLFGTDTALKEFKRHIKRLRDEQVRLREHHYLQQLPRLLKHYLPNLETVADRGWSTILQSLRTHPDFSSHFVDVCQPGETWKSTDSFLYNLEEKRIPFDLLTSAEAEIHFRNHLHELQARQKKKELQRQFKRLLEENIQVSVGRPLSETYVFLVGKECYNALEENERAAVYEEHQQELRSKARLAFHELLWERSDVFWNLSSTQRLTREDLNTINQALQDDERYRAFVRLEEERNVMILNHLGFLQCPSRDRCYYRDSCVDNQLINIRAGYMSSSSGQDASVRVEEEPGESNLNLVLLGKEDMAVSLNRDIRNVCVDDEFMWEGVVYNLDYRPIDGDVSREQNALATVNFRPHGCICVYNSEETLEYIQSSLEHSLFSQAGREEDWRLQNMPIVLLLEGHTNLSSKEHEVLRELGQQLAVRLHVEFIDTVENSVEKDVDSDSLVDENQLPHFSEQHIQAALQTIVLGVKNLGLHDWPSGRDLRPDIHICMCIMCGDPFPLELPLGPLLQCEGLKVEPENPYAFTLQAYLESRRQNVEVEVVSYHGRTPITHRPITHGYILVYSAERLASFATLRAFASRLPAVPKLIVAVADSGGAAQLFFNNEVSHTLIREGNQLADELDAVFLTTTANFMQQTAAYLPFFRDVLELRDQSEAICMLPLEEPCPPAYEDDRASFMDRRPPAPLPKYYDTYHTTKSSTSNSQSTDSEPVYDQPNLYQSRYSDSEHERASSVSPPVSEDIYSDIPSQDGPNGEHLVRPSFVRTRRDMYKAWALNDQHRRKVKTLPPVFKTSSSGDEDSIAEPPNPELNDETWSKGRSLAHPTKYHSQSGMAFRSSAVSKNGQVSAPLAQPEHIEIADYSLVKDAVPYEEGDSDYALVDDALPPGQLHRIRSTKSPGRYVVKGHTDSEDSEFSSLERDKDTSLLIKRGHRSSSHRKKNCNKNHNVLSQPNSSVSTQQSLKSSLQYRKETVRSHSPSEGSEGTGDEMLGAQSFKHHRTVQSQKVKISSPQIPASQLPPVISATADPESGRDDRESLYEAVMHFQTLPTRYGTAVAEEGEDELNDSTHWSNKILSFKTLRDPEKQRKKDERRRQKEEEKKLKEAQKRKIKKKDSKIFSPSQSGCCLEDFPTSSSNPFIPLFVEKCVNYIEAEGMSTEGIYRIPGNRGQGDLFITKFNEDPSVDITSLEIPVNAIATVLKSFFNELAEPLVPRSLHEELMEAAGVPDKSSRLLMLRGVIKKLPERNFEVLKFLIRHLCRVCEHQAEHNMDGRNLSRCWWPTIMRMEFASYEAMLQFSMYPEEIILTLIQQCNFFFFGGDEV